MSSLSIILPDALAKASQMAAKELGISRTQFIRQAIVRELENYQAKLEQEMLIKSIQAMKKSKKYLKDVERLMKDLDYPLPKEEAEWWTKK